MGREYWFKAKYGMPTGHPGSTKKLSMEDREFKQARAM